MFTPGATRSGFLPQQPTGPLLEKSAMESSKGSIVLISSEAPTVIILGLIPGDAIVLLLGPEFPAAATTTKLLSHRALTPLIKGSIVAALFGLDPRDNDTIRILYLSLLSSTHCIPARISDALPLPLLSRTLIPIILASGAIPLYLPLDMVPFPATVPATWVPWPLSS